MVLAKERHIDQQNGIENPEKRCTHMQPIDF